MNVILSIKYISTILQGKRKLCECHTRFLIWRQGLSRRLKTLDVTPRGIIWMGAWRTLHPRRILHALGAISVHGNFRQESLKPGPSGQELRTLPTGQLQPPVKSGEPVSQNSEMERWIRLLENIFFSSHSQFLKKQMCVALLKTAIIFIPFCSSCGSKNFTL